MQNESNLMLVQITVCIESCLPMGWRTFIWWKNLPKCCSILVWIAGCWNSSLMSRNPKNNWCLSRIFGAWFCRKNCGLSIWAHANRNPNKQEVGFIFAWSNAELWTLIKYSRSKIKIKNLMRFMSFSRPIQLYHSHADPIWPDGMLCREGFIFLPCNN